MFRTKPVAIVALLLAASAPALANGPDSNHSGSSHSGSGPGCDPRRVATAFGANGVALARQPAHPPLACGVSTGFGGAESHLVALRSGGVVFTPGVVPAGLAGTGTAPIPVGTNQSNASPAGLALTRDQGAHWSLLRPAGTTWNPTDHGEYVDPATGRLFFENYGPIPLAPAFGSNQEGPAHITWSGDEGATWTHTAISTVFIPENPRFTSARPPKGQPTPSGYPTVVYFCANSNIGFTSPVIAERLCFRSLDGGSTWQQSTILLNGTKPVHAECAGNPETYSAIDGYYPQAATDGTLYSMVACGQVTFLAHSTDEATSFPIVRTPSAGALALPVPPGAKPELRIDDRNRMYLLTTAGAGLSMRVSITLGRTWSQPLNLTTPGVTAILQSAFAVSPEGEVAVAYLGQRLGQSTWDGYLTASKNAAAVTVPGGQPVLFGGRVNDPAQPLLYGNSVQGGGYLELPGGVAAPYPPPFGDHMFGNDFIGATVTADGSAWGSFTQDCGPTPKTGRCPSQNDETRGFAGRLQF